MARIELYERKGALYEWDPVKAARNVQAHGISFATAIRIWDGRVVEQVDDREDYGEARFVDIGMIGDRYITVVYTWRGDIRRIISARKAEAHERKEYQAHTDY